MPVIRSAEVGFTPGFVQNYQRRVLVSPDVGSAAVTLGEAIMNPDAEIPMHTHPVEQVMVITRGTATVVMGEETHTLEPSDVILAPAGVKHMLANHGKEPLGFLFFFPAIEVQLDLV